MHLLCRAVVKPQDMMGMHLVQFLLNMKCSITLATFMVIPKYSEPLKRGKKTSAKVTWIFVIQLLLCFSDSSVTWKYDSGISMRFPR